MITALDTFTFMLIHYYGVRKLEAIFCLLIGIMGITFGINFFRIAPPVGDVMYGWIVPRCKSSFLITSYDNAGEKSIIFSWGGGGGSGVEEKIK